MKQNHLLTTIALLLAMALGLSSCEKAIFDEEQEPTTKKNGNVTLRASMFNIVPFDTRAVQNIADYCTKLCFVLYNSSGAVVKEVTQKSGDSGYGEVSLSLEPATYKLLILAHSSTSNPTLTNPASLLFTDNMYYSDTFYYYGDLVVTTDDKTHDLQLQRATTMVRFTITDEVPSNVKTILCKWEGQSGTFNATTGWGLNTSSVQMVVYDVTGLTPPISLKLFTFMHENEGTLKLTVTARGTNSSDVVASKVFDAVPIKNHMVTEYNGRFFSSGESTNGFNITAETEWQVYQQLTY